MPRWLKILLGALVAAAGLLMVADLVVPRLLEGGFARFEEVMDEASAAGAAHGEGADMEACIAAVARRSATCSSVIPCTPGLSSFLWGCLEAARPPADACAPLPDPADEAAVASWAGRACARHARPNAEACVLTLSMVPSFCSADHR